MKASAFPPSAMQQSMLLSSMKLPDAGIYLLQYIGYLNEALQETDFRLAWSRLAVGRRITKRRRLTGSASRE